MKERIDFTMTIKSNKNCLIEKNLILIQFSLTLNLNRIPEYFKYGDYFFKVEEQYFDLDESIFIHKVFALVFAETEKEKQKIKNKFVEKLLQNKHIQNLRISDG